MNYKINNITIIEQLRCNKMLTKDNFRKLLTCTDQEAISYLKIQAVKMNVYQKDIYIRGLIECTNICKQDCFYCGIRKSNKKAQRYSLSKEDILLCCEKSYAVGIRTFVLQGGESLTDEFIIDVVSTIKNNYADCAVTLSLGEKSYESYLSFFHAGADRYLLRHETANNELYAKLHPGTMTLSSRLQCLENLKEIGYQVGCGFMVGAPYQTIEHIIEDLYYIKKLQPHMVGIGPFIPHRETPFFDKEAGNIELTLILLSIIRLMLPKVLLPATTALGSLSANGMERGISASANVVMPNFTPNAERKKYLLYNNKISTGFETAEGYLDLKKLIENIGYRVRVTRGDALI